MFGLIGTMLATEGSREQLLGIMLNGMVSMPGCRSYAIARDPTDAMRASGTQRILQLTWIDTAN